ncbi:LIM and calponin homology domains-containing protein 1 isoform X2 [Salmo salar]|uniref:LIM and calponin homology domains-containing protein 1 isoform X2 n=1 Tax=Salmo salar TaxID=8030 RepID=A0ABM3EFE8_SALSA|nr:LIM and calponin homology domains-containing protein 1 isoform X2 [Salmo salar]
MASTGAEREEPHLPRDEPRHPEPAFREAQKWIEEVTGKSFGEKDFRSGLENGILLCELLCSIRPGLVQKINRLPSPIAGLDNLSVFLRGCEELGLKGSQLFNPGDLQDTSIQDLRDSECSRKLKNVLITIFWLGKASSVCPSYDGPVLNLREFEGLRSQMRTLSEDRSGSDSVRPRDSGYDCWDSERSQSLSPLQHTRDNSLDSLDSFGSRSQTSPSPDVFIHGNSDVDSDGDAPNRKSDVRRDDMLARRTSAGESRTFVPFNQFLPNRNVPTARRRSRPQDGEHGRLSRRVSKMSEELESISIINMHSKEEGAGHLQPLGQSGYQGMQEQYTNHQEEEWQDDLARWKSRRRSASRDLIRKEEERKRMERMMKEEEGGHTQKKNIKTYREIVEDKERREAELCDAYRRAGSKEEAAMVLQRYALRFTISDSTLDSLQLPRTITTDRNPESRTPATNQNPESRTITTDRNPESRTPTTNQNPESRTITTNQNPESRTTTTNQNPESRTPATNQNPESRTIPTNQNPESRTITTNQNPESRTTTTDQNPESRTITTNQNPESRTTTTDQNPESRTITTNQNPESRTTTTDQNPESRTTTTDQNPESRTITTNQNPESRTPATNQNPEFKTISTDQNPESRTITTNQNSESRTSTTDQNLESRTSTTDQNLESRTSTTDQNLESRTITTDQNPESRTITTQNPESRTISTTQNPESRTISTTQTPESRTTTTDQNPERAGNGLEARQTDTKQEPRHTKHTHTQHTQHTHTHNHSTQSQHTLPPPISPPSRPLPLLTAKPYCQPAQTQPGHQPVKVDGLVRVNGETLPSSPLPSPSSPLHSPPPTEHPGANQKTQVSAVSALIGGRSCVVTTTIVTELTQTHLRPRPLDILSNTQVIGSMASSRRSGEEAGSDSSLLSNQHTCSSSVTEGLEGSSGTMESPMLNLAKRVDHWVWNPEDERRRQERWQQEQERFLKEQYLREQEKLKEEWERAQREVDEEERRHNEEEKRILEETARCHLPPPELAVQTEGIVPAQQIYASWDCESSRGQETSLDLNQPCSVKRSGSYDGPHPPSSSPSSPQPPSRCVSGKRRCSGCNQALGKGAAMNIDTLGLYFHLTCFKCGVCEVQLGDTSSGTDVRIRNGLLSCQDCYAGQPTTL